MVFGFGSETGGHAPVDSACTGNAQRHVKDGLGRLTMAGKGHGRIIVLERERLAVLIDLQLRHQPNVPFGTQVVGKGSRTKGAVLQVEAQQHPILLVQRHHMCYGRVTGSGSAMMP